MRHQIEPLRMHELLGAEARAQLRYYPAVTREPHAHRGRVTTLIESGRLFVDLGLPPLEPGTDRVMVCGSAAMLADTCALLDARGFTMSPQHRRSRGLRDRARLRQPLSLKRYATRSR